MRLPITHSLFNQKYKFENGLPKIHEHDKKKPQLFGIFIEGNIVLLYTYETDLGDGWEDQEVHNNSESNRLKALKMGSNIIEFVLIVKTNYISSKSTTIFLLDVPYKLK